MKVLASYNIKGGVGKTATAVNLGYLAAREGARVLVWDLDPQGAASFYFRVKPKIKGGSKRLLRRNRRLLDVIKGTDYRNLDLLPADFSNRHLELQLAHGKKRRRALRKVLKPLRDHYDYVLIDCAPSISLVSENVFNVSDALLVPTIPTTLSLRTLNTLIDFRDEHGLSDVRLLPFFSMVDRRKSLHRLILERPPKKLSVMLETFIPFTSEVEKMGTRRAPLATYAGHSRAAIAFEDLWAEIKPLLTETRNRPRWAAK
jgi:cellulose biosynthesis protein BcsQ